MSTPVPPRPARAFGWFIQTPAPGDTVPLNPGHTVTVTVDDNLVGNSGYVAGIYNPGDPPPPPGNCTNLPAVGGGSSSFTGEVPASVPPSQKMVIAYPEPSFYGPQEQAFTIQQSGSGSGVGGGMVTVAALGASVPTTLHAHLSKAGTRSGVYPLTYHPATAAWISDAVCGPQGFRLRPSGTDWELAVKGTTYRPSVAECGPSPPFQIVFDNVDLSAAGGGTANAAVEILLTPG